MKPKRLLDLVTLINFPPNKRIRGVYMIGNVYVGASCNVRSRITHHLALYFLQMRCYDYPNPYDRLINRRVKDYFDHCFNTIEPGVKPIIFFLSNNPKDERTMSASFNMHRNSKHEIFYHQLPAKVNT
jgi:hypothetical protein